MPTWLIVIIVVAAICGIIGFIASGGEGEGFLAGAISGGAGCGAIILKLFIYGMIILGIIKLFIWLFT